MKCLRLRLGLNGYLNFDLNLNLERYRTTERRGIKIWDRMNPQIAISINASEWLSTMG